jgi:serine/threonine protein kinase
VAAGGETSPTHSESLTREGVIAGTLPYMSPEALRGEPAGLPSDIWSFGVLLYEMATGRLPFQGKSVFDLTAAVLREPVPELAVEGKRAEALQEMDSELLKFGELITVASNVAEFYAVLEDRAKSLEWLDRAVRAGDERTDWFERDPLLANVGKEPRYRQITDGIRYRREQRAR